MDHWDSSLIMSGGNYEHTFTESGTYEYYCAVHPWTLGKVIVGNDSTVKTGVTYGPPAIPNYVDLMSPGNNRSYDAGETLEFQADIDAGTGHSIILSMEGPNGQILLQSLNTASNGNVSLDFKLPDDLVTGTYTVAAKTSGSGYDLTDSRDITIVGTAQTTTFHLQLMALTCIDGTSIGTYNDFMGVCYAPRCIHTGDWRWIAFSNM